MQTDFHFYCIAVLARAAGFNIKDSLIIAYTSNYVDNSTEGEPFKLVVEDDGFEIKFEPVRTAYNPSKRGQGLESISWSAQKRVYIPLHFIPSERFNAKKPELPYSFITQPNSNFIKYILEQAAQENQYRRHLCRIGVALHTYADTWAHQGFSGRQNSDENDVEALQIRDSGEGEYKHLIIEKIIDDLPFIDVVPEIGHKEGFWEIWDTP